MELITSSIVPAIVQTIVTMFELFGIIIILGLILGFLRNISVKNVLSSIGFGGIILTAPGVIIHELSHYIFAKIFGYSIRDVKLFRPVKGSKDGVLGYVNFSYNQRSIIQNIGLFFVGFAPVFGGTACLLLSMKYLLKDTYNLLLYNIQLSLNSTSILSLDFFNVQVNIFKTMLNSVFSISNMHNAAFWIFIYISVCISAHIALSSADLKGSYSGFITIFIVLLALNIFKGVKISASLMTTYNMLLITLLNTELLFSLIHLVFTSTLKVLVLTFKK